MSVGSVSPVDLDQAANGQVGVEVVDRSGGAVEHDTACRDDGHRFIPLRLDARDHSLDERDMPPKKIPERGLNVSFPPGDLDVIRLAADLLCSH